MTNLVYEFSAQEVAELNNFVLPIVGADYFSAETFIDGLNVDRVGEAVTQAAAYFGQPIPANIQNILDTATQTPYLPPDVIITQQLNYLRPIANVQFALEGQVGAEGTWLTAATRKNIPSDLAPILSPANAACVAITATFETLGTGGIIEFVDVDTNNVLFSWEYQNTPTGNTAIKTGNIDNELFSVLIGQKVGCRITPHSDTQVDKFADGFIGVFLVLTEREPPTTLVY